jgi:M3 family oligoendopeptidase
VLGRKKKRAGGYMTYLPVYNAPFIFANFNGTSGDINVITHECGHAFQGYLSGKDPIKEHADITMETAEIHSMSMEFFTAPFMDQFFGSRTEDYSSMHLEDAAIFIPYGCMVDEFQHIVYENPQMTPAQRHQAWIQLEKEYRPIWIIPDILTLKREDSGRNSLISMTIRSIILITALLRFVHFSTK